MRFANHIAITRTAAANAVAGKAMCERQPGYSPLLPKGPEAPAMM